MIFEATAAIIFILSVSDIWVADSITYQYNFATGERIESISDIFTSQYTHYFTWNGRYVAHWMCQLFLPILGKGVFSAVNALMYIALILLVIKIVTKDPFTPARILTATCLILFFCDTEYIPTCQIGYVWMSVLVLGYLCVFFSYAKSKKHSAWNCLWLFPFSIIAGNGHEVINVGIGASLIIYALMNFKRLTANQWYMFIGFGIGGLFLCLSPASIGRADSMVIPLLYTVVYFFLNLRVTYVFLAIFLYKLLKRRVTLRDFYIENAFFINAMIVLVVFNFLIGVGSNRQLLGIELISCILVLKLLKNHSFRPLALWIFTIFIIFIYILKYQEIKKAETVYDEVSAKISINADGPIFVDFPRFNLYIHPTAFFRYGVFLDYTLESIRNEQACGIAEGGIIPCYPTKVEEILDCKVENRSYEYLPGEFILMQSKEEPGFFLLHRNIEIFGLRIPLPPYVVKFDQYSGLNTEEYNILYLPENLPIIKNGNVTIE